MKSIDDRTLGPAQIRQAKAQGNAGGLHGNAKSKSEFDNAFADAGKKAQPHPQATSRSEAESSRVEKPADTAVTTAEKATSPVRAASKTDDRTPLQVRETRQESHAASMQRPSTAADNDSLHDLDDRFLSEPDSLPEAADGPLDKASKRVDDRSPTLLRTADTIDRPVRENTVARDAPDRTRSAATARDVPDRAQPAVMDRDVPDRTQPSVTARDVPDRTQPSVTARDVPDRTQPPVTARDVSDRTRPPMTTRDVPERARTAITAPDVPRENAPVSRTAVGTRDTAAAADATEIAHSDRPVGLVSDRITTASTLVGITQTRASEGKVTTAPAAIKDAPTKLEKAAVDVKTEVAATKVHTRAPDPETRPKAATDQPAETGADPASSQLDVSQLLTLLAPPPAVQAAAAPPSKGEAVIPALSEFQALADRAVKPRSAEPATGAAEPDADAQAIANATGADKTFHFARADGKGQAVSMKVSADGERTVSNADGNAAAKSETVTVLEARRYLGLPANGNAFAITNAIARDPAIASAPVTTTAGPLTSSHAETSTGKVLNTLKIQMHPIDLGLVTATLRLKDDELHVDLKVETGDAFRQLSGDQNDMVKALRAQGFAVDQINIVFNAPDSSSTASAPQGQGQTAPQGRELAGDGTGQGRGQRSGDNQGQQQRGNERWTGNEGSVDTSGSSDAGRTGDVYM